MSRNALVARAVRGLAQAFGVQPAAWAIAPGRVNLIGDHTDYQGGLSLAVAVPWAVAAATAPAPGAEWRVASAGHAVAPPLTPGPPEGPAFFALPSWARLAQGVLTEANVPGGGYAFLAADLPEGAGLSSSAAFELALAAGALAAHGRRLPPRRVLCRAMQEAEHRYAGVPCGLLDQLTIAFARRGCAVWVDSGRVAVRQVSFRPEAEGYRLAVLEVGADRSLAHTGYAQRLAETEEAARRLGVVNLSRLSREDLRAGEGRLPPLLAARVRHVVGENERVEAVAEAAAGKDWARVGRLWVESHRSLRDDYASSHPLLDRVQAALLAGEPPVWSRVTGGGFGGSLIALVPPGVAATLEDRLRRAVGAQGDSERLMVRWLRASPGLRWRRLGSWVQ